MEENDAQLQLKKRARRRLVGAIAFVVAVAIVLPMIMDHEPKQVIPEVDIRIPGQDDKPFAPKFATAPAPAPLPAPAPAEVKASAPTPTVPTAPPLVDVVKPSAVVETVARPGDSVAASKPQEKPIEKTVEKAAEKPADKPQAKPEKPAVDKAAEKAAADKAKAEKAAADKARADDAKRAAAILAGVTADAAPAPRSGGGEHVILIGAFASEANVKSLRSRLSEQGVKTYTEALDSPQGKKTRLRAGPFANRDAAEKALEKMKRIGVSGVVAAKQ